MREYIYLRSNHPANLLLFFFPIYFCASQPIIPLSCFLSCKCSRQSTLNIGLFTYPGRFRFSTQNRSIGEDLRSMMCADALATARSTLICLTTFHTTATTIYEPSECNSKLEALSIVRPETKVGFMGCVYSHNNARRYNLMRH